MAPGEDPRSELRPCPLSSGGTVLRALDGSAGSILGGQRRPCEPELMAACSQPDRLCPAGWWGTSGPRKSAWTCTQCMWSPTLWILTWRSPRRCPRRVMASGPSPWFSDPRGAVPPSHLSRLWQLGVSGSALSSLPPPRAQVAGPWGRGTVYAPGSSLSSMRVPTPGTHCPPSRAGATLLYFRFLLHGLSLAPPCIFLLLCPLKLAGLLGLCPAPPPLNTRTGPAALATPEGTASGRRTRAGAPAPPTLSP